MNLILAIDTSCDETSAAVTDGRRVLSNVISSQINLHKKYGGVFPSLAKRAHEERIDHVVEEALKRAAIALKKEEQKEPEGSEGPHFAKASRDKQEKNNSQFDNSIIVKLSAVAVTQGPGLAIALEVGIRKAKELVNGAKEWEMRSGSRSEDEKWVEKNQNPPPLPTPDSPLTSHPHPKLIAVNHLEGHIYSCLAETNVRCENRSEKLEMKCEIGSKKNQKISLPTSISSFQHPTSHLQFPTLCLIVSGGHTQLTLMKDHGIYETIGQTLDDACGEALDKAARILKLGYPGGPVIERLAEEYLKKHEPIVIPTKSQCKSGRTEESLSFASQLKGSLHSPADGGIGRDDNVFHFNQSLHDKNNLNFSYSGLKTQLLYLVQSLAEKDFNASLRELAFSFQEACFEQILRKTSQAIKIYQPKSLVCGGGVIANKHLRKLLRDLAKKNSLSIYFPQNKKLITDNAAMIGVAAYFKMLRGEFVEDPDTLDREPRLGLS